MSVLIGEKAAFEIPISLFRGQGVVIRVPMISAHNIAGWMGVVSMFWGEAHCRSPLPALFLLFKRGIRVKTLRRVEMDPMDRWHSPAALLPGRSDRAGASGGADGRGRYALGHPAQRRGVLVGDLSAPAQTDVDLYPRP